MYIFASLNRPNMQKASTAQTGLKTTTIFIALSSFIIFQNPVKYIWTTGLLSLSMLYFALKRYKEEKAMGADTTKSKDIIQMSAVAAIIIFIVFVGYNLAEMGIFGDI